MNLPRIISAGRILTALFLSILLLLLSISTSFTAESVSAEYDYGFLRKFGSYGTTGNGKFDVPENIEVDNSGNIYVVDRDNHQIQKFKANGTFVTKWGSKGSANGQFDMPYDIAINTKNSRAYVTDVNNNRVQVFKLNGDYVSTISTGMYKPHSIAVNPSLGWIYVTGYFYRSASDKYYPGIEVYKIDDGSVLNIEDWDVETTINRLRAKGIDVDFQGRVFIANTTGNKVEVRDEFGGRITEFGKLGSADGSFWNPYSVKSDVLGNVFVADKFNHRVQIFKSDGTYINKIGTKGVGDGQFKTPAGVTIDPLGRLFVADTGNDRIQVFRSGEVDFSGSSMGYTKDKSNTLQIENPYAYEFRVKNKGPTVYSEWKSVQSDYKWSLGTMDGVKNILVQVRDKYGNYETKPYTASIYLETTKPTLASISSPLLSSDVNKTGYSFKVNWSATDNVSGVDSYDVQVKTNAGLWKDWKMDTQNTSASFAGKPGNAYYFRFRARDNAGNITGWSSSKVTMVPFDERVLSYSSGWYEGNDMDGYYLGTLKYSKASGSSATYTFKGNGIYIVGANGPEAGIANIYVDDVLIAKVDLYSSIKQRGILIFSKKFDTSAERKIKIVVSGSKNSQSSNTWVDLDGIAILK